MDTRLRSHRHRGHELLTLANDRVSVSFAPGHGGRIVSLADRVGRREWVDGWAPASRRRLWHPSEPTDFASGPGAGIDECLPTVLPCRLGRRMLPDHGELWQGRPEIDATPSSLACRWSLQSLPLDFERRATLSGDRLVLDYRLVNRARRPTPFLWAWHPLFTWRPGDELRFPRAIKSCTAPNDSTPVPWPRTAAGVDLSRASFPATATPAAKVFVGPLARGHAEIHDARGHRLVLDWPTRWLPHAGVWITRGFWKGLHHWAVEPTNAAVDRLSDLRRADPLTRLEPHESRRWSLVLKVLAPGS